MLPGSAVYWSGGKTLCTNVFSVFMLPDEDGWLLSGRSLTWTFLLRQVVVVNIVCILWTLGEYRGVPTEVCLPKMGWRWNLGAYFRTLQMFISAPFNFFLSQVCWSERRHQPPSASSISGDHHFWNQIVWLATDNVALFLLQDMKLGR